MLPLFLCETDAPAHADGLLVRFSGISQNTAAKRSSFSPRGKMKGKQEQNNSPPLDIHTLASLAMNKSSLHLVSQQLTQVGNKVANHINDSSPFLQSN